MGPFFGKNNICLNLDFIISVPAFHSFPFIPRPEMLYSIFYLAALFSNTEWTYPVGFGMDSINNLADSHITSASRHPMGTRRAG